MNLTIGKSFNWAPDNIKWTEHPNKWERSQQAEWSSNGWTSGLHQAYDREKLRTQFGRAHHHSAKMGQMVKENKTIKFVYEIGSKNLFIICPTCRKGSLLCGRLSYDGKHWFSEFSMKVPGVTESFKITQSKYLQCEWLFPRVHDSGFPIFQLPLCDIIRILFIADKAVSLQNIS